MKTLTQIFTLAAVLGIQVLSAQTVYTISENKTLSASKIPTQCTDCIINIADGATLTINQDIYLQNSSFNGGSIQVNNNKKITFWSPGEFNNVDVTFNGSAGFVTSGTMNIEHSTWTFNGTSTAIIYTSMSLDNSKMIFLENANFLATGGTFRLDGFSALIAGDGSTSSNAFIKFNGASLQEYGNSFVSIANYNNYYFNWSSYYSGSNGISYNTTSNNINCGTPGRNTCSMPTVYGPASLNFAGLAASAILPVKLSAFEVKLSGARVNISWTTDMEMNADRFEIERSADGMNWELAGTVKATGNSSVAINYNFSELVNVSGNASYRLKMIDQDETFEYSPIRSVKLSEVPATAMRIYPNPATHFVIIESRDGAREKMNIQVVNLNGQVMKQSAGQGRVTVQVNDLLAGNYFVRVSNDKGNVQSHKLLIGK